MTVPTEVSRAVGAMRVAREAITRAFERRVVQAHPTPSCDAGCSHCCQWPISISILEGLNILTHLRDFRRWSSSLKERVRTHADAVTGLTYPVWLGSATPCAFLDARGRCEIYEARPLLCRTAASNGPPEECSPHNIGKAQSILKRTDIIVLFQNAERGILQRSGIEYHTMPISTAILAADHIYNGKVEFNQAGTAIFAEHLGRF